MMSVIVLQGVTYFLHLKDITNTCEIVKLLAGFLHCNGAKLEEAETLNLFWSFIVCSS